MGRTKLDGGGGKVMRKNPARIEVKSSPKQAVVNADRSGDWMASDELRAAALSAVEAGSDVTLQLGGIDHLDASALQILLALNAEQKRRGRQLELAGASPQLRQWFAYAGAAEEFFPDGVEGR
ncbi:MAG: STAS domain-containing protein [Terracidiphilus sp.]